MRSWTWCASAGLAFVAGGVGAQVPRPSPAVGSLSGIVADPGGRPLGGVDVTLVGEAARTRTDSTGRFALSDVPPGRHVTLFRHIGYRSVEYRWTSVAGRELRIAVTMRRAPRTLDRVVVEAPRSSRRRGTSTIGGAVFDSLGTPVAGADVRLLGSGLSTITDASGRYQFGMLAAGSYIIRVRRRGLAPSAHVIQIIDDDRRDVTLKLFGLPPRAKTRDSTASGYGAADVGFDAFDHRGRAGLARMIMGPGDLFRTRGTPLDMVLRRYRQNALPRASHHALANGQASAANDGDCILIDGRRAVYRPLGTFRNTSIQLIEVFPANAIVDGFLVSLMDGLRECRGGMDRHPSYFVLWTRGLR